jgi:hypothetical protein
MVTSTPSENLSLHLYKSQNKIFYFGTMKTLILHARFFLKGGHLTKTRRIKIFSMKTLSKLGALTVAVMLHLLFSYIWGKGEGDNTSKKCCTI